MSRFIISIVILAVMSAGCVWAVYGVNSIADKMLECVSETEDAFVNGDTEKCVKRAEELKEMWESFMEYSILINDLGHALEITSSIAEINSFAQDENDELYAACDRAEAQIEMFRDMQQPTIWKIL